MHVPQFPWRQPKGMEIPFASPVSSSVRFGDEAIVNAERANVTLTELSSEAGCSSLATCSPKLSCKIREECTDISSSKVRASFINPVGPHEKKVESRGFAISASRIS